MTTMTVPIGIQMEPVQEQREALVAAVKVASMSCCSSNREETMATAVVAKVRVELATVTMVIATETGMATILPSIGKVDSVGQCSKHCSQQSQKSGQVWNISTDPT